jgi:hypothetical protein
MNFGKIKKVVDDENCNFHISQSAHEGVEYMLILKEHYDAPFNQTQH